MNLTRRNLLLAAGSLPLARSSLAIADAHDSPRQAADGIDTELPNTTGFAPMGATYLDSGSQHPVSLGARASLDRYLAKRMLDPEAADYDLDTTGLLAKYAKLVNADPAEVTFVQSTTTGEQMFLRSLGLPESGGHVVTDTLHFFGSLPMYADFAKRGVEVTWVHDRDGRIPLEEMDKAIRPGTKLVALSLVSTINGFTHDLKAVCDIAHARGALVYADIIHAVGCMPLDLHASGVDMAAGASYKWLMGDFGLGFLYVRKDVLPKLQRSNWGYYGLAEFQSHVYPFDPPADPPGDTVVDYRYRDDATGMFALGTYSHTVPALLHGSLDYLLATGVDRIQAHAQTLIARLKKELPERGFQVITPPESTAPIVTCAYENARGTLGPRLQEANVRIPVSRNRFRVTPSVFNTLDDVDRLLEALGRA